MERERWGDGAGPMSPVLIQVEMLARRWGDWEGRVDGKRNGEES